MLGKSGVLSAILGAVLVVVTLFAKFWFKNNNNSKVETGINSEELLQTTVIDPSISLNLEEEDMKDEAGEEEEEEEAKEENDDLLVSRIG